MAAPAFCWLGAVRSGPPQPAGDCGMRCPGSRLWNRMPRLRPGRALLSEFGDGKSEYLFDVPLHRKRVYDMMGGIRPGGACPAKFEDRTGRIR